MKFGNFLETDFDERSFDSNLSEASDSDVVFLKKGL